VCVWGGEHPPHTHTRPLDAIGVSASMPSASRFAPSPSRNLRFAAVSAFCSLLFTFDDKFLDTSAFSRTPLFVSRALYESVVICCNPFISNASVRYSSVGLTVFVGQLSHLHPQTSSVWSWRRKTTLLLTPTVALASFLWKPVKR